MSLFKSYWTVESISPNARDAAIRAANADGEELGVWLSRLIAKVSEEEREADADSAVGAEEALENSETSTVVKAVEDGKDAIDGEADSKMSSIERAMLQSRASGDAGPR